MTPVPASFQAFTLRFNGLAGQLISDILVFEAFDPDHPPANPPKAIKTRALWDTGASKSVISPHVVAALGLQPVGATQVLHAGGSSMSPTYVVNFQLPNQVGVSGVLASEFPNMGNAFEVIVGMDVITLGDLSLTHVDGKTCMSFRTPSTAENDFVKQANRQLFAKVGRNDPCPCGAMQASGKPKKFKDCHQPIVKL